MPTPLTHGLVGASLAQVAPRAVPKKRFALLLSTAAVLPDVDLVSFHFGISYSHSLGHRGFSHSLLFAVAVGLIAGLSFGLWHRLDQNAIASVVGLSTLAVVSHGVLDAATSGGLGVGFLLPFNDSRFFLPFRPIAVSPINPAKFPSAASRVLGSEALCVWGPVFLASCSFQLARLLHLRLHPPPLEGHDHDGSV